MSRTNFIFVDYENVLELDLDRIGGKAVKVALVLGKRQKSLPLALVKVIQKYADQVRLIETELDGKNALDFVLACEVGAEAERNPEGFFHVLSKDKGFDALIKHLQKGKFHAARHSTLAEIRPLMNPEERTRELKATFARPEVGRAKTKRPWRRRFRRSLEECCPRRKWKRPFAL